MLFLLILVSVFRSFSHKYAFHAAEGKFITVDGIGASIIVPAGEISSVRRPDSLEEQTVFTLIGLKQRAPHSPLAQKEVTENLCPHSNLIL